MKRYDREVHVTWGLCGLSRRKKSTLSADRIWWQLLIVRVQIIEWVPY